MSVTNIVSSTIHYGRHRRLRHLHIDAMKLPCMCRESKRRFESVKRYTRRRRWSWPPPHLDSAFILPISTHFGHKVLPGDAVTILVYLSKCKERTLSARLLRVDPVAWTYMLILRRALLTTVDWETHVLGVA